MQQGRTSATVEAASLGAAPNGVRVLVVDHDDLSRRQLVALVEALGHGVRSAPSAREALAQLEQGPAEVVVCELQLPEQDGLWLLEAVRTVQPGASVVVVSAAVDTSRAVDCLHRGAADFVSKPPRADALARALDRALGRRRNERDASRYRSDLELRVAEKTRELSRALGEVAQAYQATLAALVAALDAREHETGDHSQRVVRFTLAIAEKMGLQPPELDEVARGALLHDIGKIGVSDSILLKPGPLTPEEWVEMRRHPDIGYAIIERIPFLASAAEIVRSHQERWDGKGYPRGLQGESLPLGARIFAIADTFDAIVSDRPYRKGRPFADARAEIARCAGTQFDPRAVEAFLQLDDDTLAALYQRRPATIG